MFLFTGGSLIQWDEANFDYPGHGIDSSEYGPIYGKIRYLLPDVFGLFFGYIFFILARFLAPYGPLLASFRSQIDPPNFIWTESHQFSTKSVNFMTFSIFRPATPCYRLPGPPLSSSAAIYSESGVGVGEMGGSLWPFLAKK